MRELPRPAQLSQVAHTWGSTEGERRRRYACDDLIEAPEVECWRAVDVDAPAATVFRWLCQLRAAPYSYDWIDNLGRRSPRHLIPGLDDLELGQRVMTIFRLVDFDVGRQLTIRTVSQALLGDVAVTYEVVSRDQGCRLVVKIVLTAPAGPMGWAWRRLAAPADLVMMRKQLLTLKYLAERDAGRAVPSSVWRPPRTSLLPRPH